MTPIVFAESYPIGIPFAILGLALIVFFKPVPDFYAGFQREIAALLEHLVPRRARGRLDRAARRYGGGPRLDGLPLRDHSPDRRVVLLAGLLAVIGFWNPYE